MGQHEIDQPEIRPLEAATHPSPHRDRVAKGEALFGVAGGPLAWLVQLCAGFALASQKSFPRERLVAEPAPMGTALVLILVTCLAVALGALLVSWLAFRRTRGEQAGEKADLIEIGHGRTRFLALWGMILGAGFALLIAANLIALLQVPPCAG